MANAGVWEQTMTRWLNSRILAGSCPHPLSFPDKEMLQLDLFYMLGFLLRFHFEWRLLDFTKRSGGGVWKSVSTEEQIFTGAEMPICEVEKPDWIWFLNSSYFSEPRYSGIRIDGFLHQSIRFCEILGEYHH